MHGIWNSEYIDNFLTNLTSCHTILCVAFSRHAERLILEFAVSHYILGIELPHGTARNGVLYSPLWIIRGG